MSNTTETNKLDLILRNQARLARAIEEIILGVGHSEEEAFIWRDTRGYETAQTQVGRVMRESMEALGEDAQDLYK